LSGAEFKAYARQNRSQSFRIDEDFNKAEAEILPQKSRSFRIRAPYAILYTRVSIQNL